MTNKLTITETRSLVELINTKYAYNLSGYTEASLKRRFERYLDAMGLSLFELKYKLTNSSESIAHLADFLTVNVTEMFRDPSFYKSVVDDVIPVLAGLDEIRIWHAGCSTGEEAYSMAILLEEAGLLSRSTIYATDINTANLEKAGTGIIAINKMKSYTKNYLEAGGRSDFSDYYTAGYDGAIIDRKLRNAITFFRHNLLADEAFGTFHLICCRNVLIYFKRAFQLKVITLFGKSLIPNGFLALGNYEPMSTSSLQNQFEPLSAARKIFKSNTNYTIQSPLIVNPHEYY